MGIFYKMMIPVALPLALIAGGYALKNVSCGNYSLEVNQERIMHDVAKAVYPYVELGKVNEMENKVEKIYDPRRDRINKIKEGFKNFVPWLTLDDFFEKKK